MKDSFRATISDAGSEIAVLKDRLKDSGIEIKDYTGKTWEAPYDEMTWEDVKGSAVSKYGVIRMVSPKIIVQGEIIQEGKLVIIDAKNIPSSKIESFKLFQTSTAPEMPKMPAEQPLPKTTSEAPEIKDSKTHIDIVLDKIRDIAEAGAPFHAKGGDEAYEKNAEFRKQAWELIEPIVRDAALRPFDKEKDLTAGRILKDRNGRLMIIQEVRENGIEVIKFSDILQPVRLFSSYDTPLFQKGLTAKWVTVIPKTVSSPINQKNLLTEKHIKIKTPKTLSPMSQALLSSHAPQALAVPKYRPQSAVRPYWVPKSFHPLWDSASDGIQKLLLAGPYKGKEGKLFEKVLVFNIKTGFKNYAVFSRQQKKVLEKIGDSFAKRMNYLDNLDAAKLGLQEISNLRIVLAADTHAAARIKAAEILGNLPQTYFKDSNLRGAILDSLHSARDFDMHARKTADEAINKIEGISSPLAFAPEAKTISTPLTQVDKVELPKPVGLEATISDAGSEIAVNSSSPLALPASSPALPSFEEFRAGNHDVLHDAPVPYRTRGFFNLPNLLRPVEPAIVPALKDRLRNKFLNLLQPKVSLLGKEAFNEILGGFVDAFHNMDKNGVGVLWSKMGSIELQSKQDGSKQDGSKIILSNIPVFLYHGWTKDGLIYHNGVPAYETVNSLAYKYGLKELLLVSCNPRVGAIGPANIKVTFARGDITPYGALSEPFSEIALPEDLRLSHPILQANQWVVWDPKMGFEFKLTSSPLELLAGSPSSAKDLTRLVAKNLLVEYPEAMGDVFRNGGKIPTFGGFI
ncbi:MAG: hypothetical protein HZB36_05815, partial [Candidatus Omnitrophica bacterium]|nr:hypothetical protein [Candidatus Omnitrophota bacterium]